MELKDRLQELRGDITRTDCANSIGVLPHNYSRWERGISNPDYKTLIQIADYYDVSLDYLTGRTDFKNADYQQTTIETGLTENALKGLSQLKKSSETGQIDLLTVLNRLLERELDPKIQENISELQNRANSSYLFELFPDYDMEDYPISLSALLVYIAHSAKNADDALYTLGAELRKKIEQFSLKNDKETARFEVQTYHILDIARNMEAYAEPRIASYLLYNLRSDYCRSSFLKQIAPSQNKD